MAKTGCGYCGASLLMLRTDARFCSTKCRVYASRKLRFPAAMVQMDRWMRWVLVTRGVKSTKVPLTLTGARGSSTNPDCWFSFDEAKASKCGSGMGFAMGSGIGCIDLDHCIVDGELAGWAREILDRTPPTFVEVSQSGTGLHIFGLLGDRPGRRIRRGEAEIEIYTSGQYIAVTGNRFERAPLALADLSEVVTSIT